MQKIQEQKGLKRVSMTTLTSEDKEVLVEEDKKHGERIEELRLRSILNEMKIPTDYRKKRYKNYSNVEIASKVKKIVDLKLSLVLSGKTGRGKTHLAVASLLYMMKKYENGKPLFLSAPELFVELRDRIKNNVTEQSIIDRYLRVPLLLIDDLGVETTTDRSVETFYSIVDGRSRSNNQLIITSELTLREIGEIYGDRLASRLCGMGEYLRIEGDDYRIKMQNERAI
ncbi:ATP-binding protein [Candidatus Pacearchaeota archaeon]|nr:ATP-binding protein [Candidatus Pacearchaeota archaeon]